MTAVVPTSCRLRPPELLVVASEFFRGEKAKKSRWLGAALSVFESLELSLAVESRISSDI